jgi:hypothetical protein
MGAGRALRPVVRLHTENRAQTKSAQADFIWTGFVRRFKHLPAKLVMAQAAEEVAQADDLLDQVRDLQARTLAILEAAETTRQHRTALSAIREARSNLELLVKLLGELAERPVTNVLVSAEWVSVRTAMMEAPGPYPQARVAVAERLSELEAGRTGKARR